MKQFLLITILVAGLAACQESEKEVPPNILWLTCEDISPTLSMYGDSTAHTPNLDKLASESIIFTNAYAPVAVCAPSRSSLITGMYPTSIGTQHMRTGKDVQGWGTREYSGLSKARDINGDSIPLYSVVVPPDVKCFTEYLRAEGYFCTNSTKTDYQFAAPVTSWDENGNNAHWRNRKEGQPFFSVFNFNVTHESMIWKNKDLPLTVDPDEVILPAYYPENEIVREDVARNYSNIELLDQQIGEMLKALEEDSLLDNTVIFFFSDHGGPLPRGKRENYDSGLKVPLLVRIPGEEKMKYDSSLLSFVDMAPTIMGIAGIKPPDYLQGQDFFKNEKSRKYIYGSGDRFDEFSDRSRIVRDNRYLYVRNYYPELPAYKDVGYRKNIPMMVNLLELNEKGQLNQNQSYYFRTSKTEEELYDCYLDPENLNNIINDESLQDKRKELSEALDEWIKRVGDKSVISEKQMLEEMWPGGIQPVTSVPEIKMKNDKWHISCATEGASIAYKITTTEESPPIGDHWQVYHKPIKLDSAQYLHAVAQRIGFKESTIVKINKK